MDITKFLGNGKENAKSRSELSDLLNLPDRQVRRLIAEARDRGEPIVSACDGTGYYMTNDIGDLKRQYRQNQSRAMSVLKQQTHLRRKIAEAENKEQMTLEEVTAR